MAKRNHATHADGDNGVPFPPGRKLGSAAFPTARKAMAPWVVLANVLLLLPTTTAWRLGLRNDVLVQTQQRRQQQHVIANIPPVDKRELSNVIDPLRKFIGDAIMRVPDYVETQETWLGTLNISLTKFFCFDASYGNITVDLIPTQTGQHGQESFQLEVTDMVFTCTVNVTWTYGNNGNQNGAGNASLVSYKNYLTALVSTDPSATNNTSCQGTTIDIDTLEFDGDLSLQVMNIYRGFIRRIVESEVETIFCKLMTKEVLGLMLNLTETKIQHYMGDVPSWQADPLSMESEVSFPSNVSIINFHDDEQAGELMSMALKNLNSIYAARNPDPMATTTDGMDFGFNTILRNTVLKDEPFFNISLEYQLINEATSLVDVNVTLTELRFYGLDMANILSPFMVIGNSSIQTCLRWDNLTIEFDMIITVAASTRPESFLRNGAQLDPIIESVTLVGGAQSIEFTVSIFVPLERTEVEVLPMGYILNWASLDRCIPPVLSNMAISGLEVTLGGIHEPKIKGVASHDIAQLSQKGILFGLSIYEEKIMELVPTLLQTRMRDSLNTFQKRFYCPVEDSVSRKLQEEEFVRPEGGAFYLNIIGAFACVCTAALAAGLTMGLLSLDEMMLLIKERAGATLRDREAAASLLPIVRQHHLLLVSLLLMNAMANEALPLFLDKLMGGVSAVVISVVLVLFFGEIIPSAVFTGPDQIKLASRMAPLVRTVMIVLSPIAWPIAKLLDCVLHEEGDSGYSRGELTALVRIQYEEHLANKRSRKSQIRNAIKQYESMEAESMDSYASRRSAGGCVRPEIKETLRALNRQISNRRSEEIHVDEVAMVEGALKMHTTAASEIYTPWNQVFTIPSDMILNERNAVKIYRSGFSRIPIFEKDEDNPDNNTKVIGILASRQLMVIDSQDQREVSTLPLSVPRCVSPKTSLVDLMNMFQTGGIRGGHMALVCTSPENAINAVKEHRPLPEEAGLMGIVTLEDVLESLIQEEIYDEYDRQERRRHELAKWGFRRWRRFVRNQKKHRGDTTYASIPDQPKMLNVVEEAIHQKEAEHEPPATESTSLLSRLKLFA